MPYVDVTRVLASPMVAGQKFFVRRRVEAVNEFGELVTSETLLPAVGSVTPTGDNSLLREEAFQTQSESIRVVTRFRLRGASKDEIGTRFQPDIVVFNAQDYLVRVVNEYNQFGAGMVEAECILIDYTANAETGE